MKIIISSRFGVGGQHLMVRRTAAVLLPLLPSATYIGTAEAVGPAIRGLETARPPLLPGISKITQSF